MDSYAPAGAVTTALVLAAGNGDRFRSPSPRSKLLHPFLGQPLIVRTLRAIRAAGLARAEIVTGYDADQLRRVVERHPVDGLRVHFIHNPEWRLENGVSVLAAAPRLAHERFALLMGDHLFEPPVLQRVSAAPVSAGGSLLAVDSAAAAPDVAAEATRVQLRDGRVVAIGKGLTPYHALDTGLFVCDPSLFRALETARVEGDTTLSAGIRRLAGQGLMFAVDVHGASWHDIDTAADLAAAEAEARAALPVLA